jgi:hypothetical protein
MKMVRAIAYLALAVVLGLSPTQPISQAAGDKKIEQAVEKGEFTSTTARDKVRSDCPAKLYSFALVEGRTYTIDLRSDAFDAYLRLEDSNGKIVAEDDDSGGGKTMHDARIVYKVPKSGTYTVVCTSYNASAKGPYTLTVVHDGQGKEEKREYLLDVNGKLTKDDPKDKGRGNIYCKTYKLEMKAKTTYVIELISKDFDAFLRLENSDGKERARDDDGFGEGLNARIIFNCDQAGTYVIYATSFEENATGAFNLRVYIKPQK